MTIYLSPSPVKPVEAAMASNLRELPTQERWPPTY